MKSSNVLKLIAEFLGFLLVSIGGTLIAIGVLLAFSRIGPGSVVGWLNLVLGCGVSGIAMVAAGVLLVRRLKA
jgi:ABC-type Fe3+ transport system permease subunit